MVQWIPGPFLALFMGAAWITRGYMITLLPVRGAFRAGDKIEMIWPGADSILLEVTFADIAANYQPAALQDAFDQQIPLRTPVIVKAPEDQRLQLEPGHFLTVPEDEPHWPRVMAARLRVAPAGVLLAEPGSLDHQKLSALPPPEQRTYHRLVALVKEGVI